MSSTSSSINNSSNDNNDASSSFPVQSSITSKLTSSLNPTYLNVVNESHMHNVPLNSETHFKVVIVSDQFNEMPTLIKRHRAVNTILADELEGPVHALSIVAKTPKQWEKMVEKANGEQNIEITPSPNCKGGDGSLPKRNEV